MRRSQNSSIPVAHEQVFAILKAIATGFSSKALLTLLELLQQAKVARNLGGHVDRKDAMFCAAGRMFQVFQEVGHRFGQTGGLREGLLVKGLSLECSLKWVVPADA